jgi:hypothetical protein
MTEKYALALDVILGYIMEQSDNGMIVPKSIEELQPVADRLMALEIKITMDEFLRMIDFLAEKKYINLTNDRSPNIMMMRFEGMDLINDESGGFVQMRLDSIAHNHRKNLNERKLVTYTVALAIGTFLLVFAEVVIHYPDFLKNLKYIFH